MQFDKKYFDNYGQYRNDIKVIKKFRDIIFACKKILWVGCSTGQGVKYLNNRGIDCIGVEINEYAISKSKIKDKLIRASILDMPFAEEQFDCVICIDLLEHLTLEQINNALDQFKQVSSDKIIVGITPKDRPVFYVDPTHVTALDFGQWEELLESQLGQRIANDFYDGRYAFSKKAEPIQNSISVTVCEQIEKLDLSSLDRQQLCSIKTPTYNDFSQQYLVIEKNGKPIGCCPLFLFEDENTKLSNKYQRIIRKLKFDFDKFAFAIFPFDYTHNINGSDKSEALKLICQKIDEICEKGYIDVNGFLCLPNDCMSDIIRNQGYKELIIRSNTKHSLGKYLSLLPNRQTKYSTLLLKIHGKKARIVMNLYFSLLNGLHHLKTLLQAGTK